MTSSFHVVGTIFDRVWIDGNPDNQFRGMQTVLLGSSSGTIVEFVIPESGKYVMVDHHFANASQGAVGTIDASDATTAPGDVEHHNIPATAAPTDPLAQRGKLNFESKCLACHSIAGGDKLGPDLYQVTRRRTEAWLTRWLKDPEGMLQTDPIAKEMLAKYKIPMANQNSSDEELKSYVAYFKWADQNLRPRGTAQPQPAAPGAARGPDQTPSAPGAAGSPQPPLPPSPTDRSASERRHTAGLLNRAHRQLRPNPGRRPCALICRRSPAESPVRWRALIFGRSFAHDWCAIEHRADECPTLQVLGRSFHVRS